MELKCDKCEYVAKSPAGLQIHAYRKHTKKGQALAKAAAARMNSPAARKKSLATRAARIAQGITPKPRRPWGSNRSVTPTRRPWGSVTRGNYVGQSRRLQHAATTHQVRFCPNCACNLEAVRVAMSFAAGNR